MSDPAVPLLEAAEEAAFIVVASPYRALAGPLLTYLDVLGAELEDPEGRGASCIRGSQGWR
jgi:hypothetical protein